MDNSGVLAIKPGGQALLSATGIIYNSGIMTNAGTVSISDEDTTLENYHNLTIESGGQVNVADGSILHNPGTITVESGATLANPSGVIGNTTGLIVAYSGGAVTGSVTGNQVKTVPEIKSRDLPAVANVLDGVEYAGGELEGTLDVAAAEAAAAAAQLATDIAEVNSNVADIKSGEVVLTGANEGTAGGGTVTITIE